LNKRPKIIKTILPIFVILAMIFTVVIPAMATVGPEWGKSSLEFTEEGQTTGTGTVTVTKEVYGNPPAEASGGYEIAITGPPNLTFPLTGGESKTRELPAGNYTVSESNSYGAAVSYSPSSSFTISGNTTQVYAVVYNNGSAMTGQVTWEVYYAASGNPKNGTIIESGAIPALGAGESHTITYTPTEAGKYMFKAYQETGHPGQGELWSDEINVTTIAGESPAVIITVTNTFTGEEEEDPGSVKIIKTIGSQNGTPQKGVTFTLKQDEEVAATGKTDEDGVIVFEGLEAGSYNLTEQVPSGYTTNLDQPYTVTVTAGETTTVKVVNSVIPPVPEKGTVKIIKTIGSQNGTPQEDVTFTLKQDEEVAATDETDENGVIVFEGLEAGSYNLTEQVPSGYTTNLDQPYTVTVTAGETTTVKVVNSVIPPVPKKGTVKIIKTIGSQNGTPQKDVTFTLLNGTTVVKTGTTDVNGELIFEGLEAGSYNLTEQVPSDYTTNLSQPYIVTVTAGETTTVKVVNSVTSSGGGGGGTTPGGGGGGGTVVVPPEEPTVPPVEPTTPPEEPGEVIVPPEEPTTEPEVILPPEEPKAQPEEEKLPYTGADANVLLGLLMGVILAGSGLFLLKKSRVK